MPKVSSYTRKRIQVLCERDLRPVAIFKELKAEGLSVSYPSVARIINKFKLTRSLENLPRSGRPTKLNEAAKAFIDAQMRKNDETTSRQIQKRLAKRGVTVHYSTVQRARNEQGWTLQNTAYCQMIREATKVKRLEYAQRVIDTGDTFHNVIFSDECSISLEQFRRTCYQKVGEPAKRKPRPKHPLKLHVWAGISRHGATNICIFEGIMEAGLYCSILRDTLIPFIRDTLPNPQIYARQRPQTYLQTRERLLPGEWDQLVANPPRKPRFEPHRGSVA